MTSLAPIHSTAVIAPNTSTMTAAVSPACVPMRRRAAASAVPTAPTKRSDSCVSRAWLCTVWMAFRVSLARALASATRSCASRDSLATRRPKNTIGRMISGMPIAAKPARRGLVSASATLLPMKVTKLRSAIEALEPTTLRSSSVSADSRETSSPERVRSKNSMSSRSSRAYRLRRRSAITFSPSRLTKKKRRAVATASSTATASRPKNQRSMAAGSSPAKPRSIMKRTATGRLSVARLDSASAPSHSATRPR